jgi:HAE1 family hydrophobic/amphiphilic exporter-1
MLRHIILRLFFLTAIFLLTFGSVNISTLAQTPDSNLATKERVEIAKADRKETIEEVENSEDTSKISNSNSLFRVGVDPSQATSLSLNDAIRRALENNNDIEVAKNDVQVNEQTLRALQGVYDPSFSISPTYTRRSQTGSTASNNFNADFGFTKSLRVGGGRFDTFFNNSRSASGSGFSDPSLRSSSSTPFYFNQLGVNYTQPLWRNREIDNNRRQIKIQRKRLEQSDADFRLRTIQVISQVQRAYWDLVFALRDQQNRVANLNLTKENMRRVEAQIAAGAAAPLARAEVATELANREADVLLAAQQVSIAENTLKQLILKDPNSPEWTVQFVPTDQPVFDEKSTVSLEESMAEAKQNRPELRRLKLQKEINSIDIQYFKNQTKPQVDLNSSFSLQGTAISIAEQNRTITLPLITAASNQTNADAYLLLLINQIRQQVNNPNIPPITQSQIPNITSTQTGRGIGGYTQALRNLFATDAPNFSVGVTITFPFRNQVAKANLAGAQIVQNQIDAQTRSQEQAVINEVRNAVQAVETSRLRVLAARTARANAEIQLQGEQKLYEVGRSTTFLLFQRENALTNARNAEIRAETDYNKALADLQRVTSTTLRANNITIESSVNP